MVIMPSASVGWVVGLAEAEGFEPPNRLWMGGVPRIRNPRVTVSMVLGQLAGEATIEQPLGD